MEIYLGVDVGSVTTKFAVLDKNNKLVTNLYLPTEGKPIAMIQFIQDSLQICSRLLKGRFGHFNIVILDRWIPIDMDRPRRLAYHLFAGSRLLGNEDK